MLLLEEPLEEPPVVVEDSRVSLQSVDSKSSSRGLSSSSEERALLSSSLVSEDSMEGSPLVLLTVEIRPVPSMSARAIATTRLPKNRATKTPITCTQ